MTTVAASSKVTLIVNPAAGGGKAGRKAHVVSVDLQGLGHEVEVQFTKSLGHATELASNATVSGRIAIAMGGDGLVSAVANGLAGKPDALMAIIPFGRGNDFARSLGIRNSTHGVQVVDDGVARGLDLGRAGDRYFTCIASVGFDSRVIEIAEKQRFLTVPLVYSMATVRALFGWAPAEFDVTYEGSTRTITGFNVAVANSANYGGGMRMAPGASLEDGLFDVIAIEDVSKSRFLIEGIKVFWGKHVKHPAVQMWQTGRITVASREGFEFYADGERLGPGPMTFEVSPKALNCLVPKGEF